MTNGAFAGLAIVLKTVVDPGDEVIYVSPPWFFYGTLIAGEGGVPVRGRGRPDRFRSRCGRHRRGHHAANARHHRQLAQQPDRPHLSAGDAGRLADDARRVPPSATAGAIYLLSDEAYRRIVFDGATFHSPTAFYPHSFLVYTYGKTAADARPAHGLCRASAVDARG